MRHSLAIGVSAVFLLVAGLAWVGARSVVDERNDDLQDAFFEEAPSRSRVRVLSVYEFPQTTMHGFDSSHATHSYGQVVNVLRRARYTMGTLCCDFAG